jgi:hypothetical protein
MLVFFNGRGMIMVEYVPPSQPVNQEFYVQVLTELQKVSEERTRFVEAWFAFSPRQQYSV